MGAGAVFPRDRIRFLIRSAVNSPGLRGKPGASPRQHFGPGRARVRSRHSSRPPVWRRVFDALVPSCRAAAPKALKSGRENRPFRWAYCIRTMWPLSYVYMLEAPNFGRCRPTAVCLLCLQCLYIVAGYCFRAVTPKRSHTPWRNWGRD